MKIRFLATAALATVLATTACGNSNSSSAGSGSSASPGASAAVSGKITVLAASSLTETFTQIGKDFQAANPGATVTFSYAGSSALAQQITAGAPADVFASASPATMKTVTDAGDATGTPAVFVKNQLVIAVPKGNPKGIKGLSDLTKPGLKVAECAKEVPCGAAAVKALAAANVKLTPVTLEQDVKSALSKVKLGEVDAALVYRTDAKSDTADVDGIEFPESAQAINDYPIAALKDAPNPSGAAAFVAFVETPAEIKVLTDAGFQQP
jgi:molybdate transport system substrate-binding protein